MKQELLNKEIDRRRTFAIISHPDAGKTTLTEKLLLFGNVIRSAGTVKGKKSGKFATSDWMEIEKKRGISVTSSVMSFEYMDKHINILDTPGHEDFSEDTYRTLTAVDSAVMIIDCTKGVEPQTIKLFKVCRMRGIPIFTFINKLDREGKEPLALLEEIEEVLGIESYAMNWPVGMGKRFLGVYDRYNEVFIRYQGKDEEERIPFNELDDVEEISTHPTFIQAKEDFELLEEAGNDFDIDKVKNGLQTPVFFGSAISNFGVEMFFRTFLDLASEPQPRQTETEKIVPKSEGFSGFIFKIQANMNPAHRDRLAFLRICSGVFERGMTVTVSRTGKTIKLTQSQQFLASDRETVDQAYPGDIIGIYDPGVYQIGDSLFDGNQNIEFDEIPTFAPELFVRVEAKNVMKGKQFGKGITQLVQEGAIQLFRQYGTESYILGAVGQLQLDVFEYRMKGEYNVEVVYNIIGSKIPRWLEDQKVDTSLFDSRNILVRDRNDQYVALFDSDFSLRWFQDKNPDVGLIDIMEEEE
ncbi:peptide chain release factor 3 [Sutcliffiella rhizosphaerae]|uniref:Peptide chain release factor 3 n=1 Tax=Sutcliffiella rhizosphaerae TaxID=2880967 RepID=A0ABM8YNM9_9BACI|nr:peptide chain release factor 3 [Sutcliffiella rhizosphaerae]CAG9621469.1 Peptide chain release factor 3 [Sutcliffiella rhizosphaerae]